MDALSSMAIASICVSAATACLQIRDLMEDRERQISLFRRRLEKLEGIICILNNNTQKDLLGSAGSICERCQHWVSINGREGLGKTALALDFAKTFARRDEMFGCPKYVIENSNGPNICCPQMRLMQRDATSKLNLISALPDKVSLFLLPEKLRAKPWSSKSSFGAMIPQVMDQLGIWFLCNSMHVADYHLRETSRVETMARPTGIDRLDVDRTTESNMRPTKYEMLVELLPNVLLPINALSIHLLRRFDQDLDNDSVDTQGSFLLPKLFLWAITLTAHHQIRCINGDVLQNTFLATCCAAGFVLAKLSSKIMDIGIVDTLLTFAPAALWVGAVLNLAWNTWSRPALEMRKHLLSDEKHLSGQVENGMFCSANPCEGSEYSRDVIAPTYAEKQHEQTPSPTTIATSAMAVIFPERCIQNGEYTSPL